MSVNRRSLAATLTALFIGTFGCSEETESEPYAFPPDPFVDSLMASGHVMWIGAHPDDETAFAPIMGEIGAERGAKLTFVLFTRGEKGTCRIAEGCYPDMATLRTQEFLSATTILQGGPPNIVHLDIPDAIAGLPVDYDGDPSDTVRLWRDLHGGTQGLIDRMRTLIETEQPSVIFTWDPRFGYTCHPDHRAVAYVVLEAVKAMGASAPKVYLTVDILWNGPSSSAGLWPVNPDDPTIIRYDANRPAPWLGGDTWQYAIWDLAAHRSKIYPWAVDAFTVTPEPYRQIDVVPVEGDFPPPDPVYDGFCVTPFGHEPVE